MLNSTCGEPNFVTFHPIEADAPVFVVDGTGITIKMRYPMTRQEAYAIVQKHSGEPNAYIQSWIIDAILEAGNR